VSEEERARQLLSGPRGRRLCQELLLTPGMPGWPPMRWSSGGAGYPVGRPEPDEARRVLTDEVRRTDLSALAADGDVLFAALVEPVACARYWQEPDEADSMLADPAVAAELRPVAEAIAASPAAQWWWSPVARSDQQHVSFPAADGELRPPVLRGASAGLQAWRARTEADEQRSARERPADPSARVSGSWWSTPVLSGVVTTGRALPPGPVRQGVIRLPVDTPVGLSLVEDSMGWETARSWPLRPAPDARVLEVAGPADWVRLVERYPWEVTASRRHDWYRTTGRDAAWVIPDWAAVAADHDGVHLTVAGYLSTAGRALPVDVSRLGRPAQTVLAGWDPDTTWWLTDVMTVDGEPVDWIRERDDPALWSPR
jgi:hypothetical protein